VSSLVQTSFRFADSGKLYSWSLSGVDDTLSNPLFQSPGGSASDSKDGSGASPSASDSASGAGSAASAAATDAGQAQSPEQRGQSTQQIGTKSAAETKTETKSPGFLTTPASKASMLSAERKQQQQQQSQSKTGSMSGSGPGSGSGSATDGQPSARLNLPRVVLALSAHQVTRVSCGSGFSAAVTGISVRLCLRVPRL
jgi:hypothetical protein